MEMKKEEKTEAAMNLVEKEVRQQFGTWSAFESVSSGKTPYNLKRRLFRLIQTANNFLAELGLEIKIVKIEKNDK